MLSIRALVIGLPLFVAFVTILETLFPTFGRKHADVPALLTIACTVAALALFGLVVWLLDRQLKSRAPRAQMAPMRNSRNGIRISTI
jgi:hypothetical protein